MADELKPAEPDFLEPENKSLVLIALFILGGAIAFCAGSAAIVGILITFFA